MSFKRERERKGREERRKRKRNKSVNTGTLKTKGYFIVLIINFTLNKTKNHLYMIIKVLY